MSTGMISKLDELCKVYHFSDWAGHEISNFVDALASVIEKNFDTSFHLEENEIDGKILVSITAVDGDRTISVNKQLLTSIESKVAALFEYAMEKGLVDRPAQGELFE